MKIITVDEPSRNKSARRGRWSEIRVALESAHKQSKAIVVELDSRAEVELARSAMQGARVLGRLGKVRSKIDGLLLTLWIEPLGEQS